MDKYPLESKTSDLVTSPPPVSTAALKRRPASMQQLGHIVSYTSKGERLHRSRKPSYYEYATWDECRRFEPLVKRGIELFKLYIIGKINSYDHPNKEIRNFVRANVEPDIKKWIGDFCDNFFAFGHEVQEVVHKWKTGPNGVPQLWIDKLVSYHSSQITYILNDYGCLTDGEELVANPSYKSGIWVPSPPTSLLKKNFKIGKGDYVGGLVRLPRGKYFYACNSIDGSNPYGNSLLESIIKYYLYKSVFSDMMATALDRYGTPLIYVKVPPQNTSEVKIQSDGTTRSKTLQEVTEEQLADLSSNTALVFTQVSKDQPVEVEALTTGNNFADSFEKAIDLCDSNILQGLGIPNLLMKDSNSRIGSGAASTKQMEIFDMQVTSYYELIMSAFVRTVIKPLIQYNFDPLLYPDAEESGSFSINPTRPEEIKDTTDMIDKLAEKGFLSPGNEEHRQWVSKVLGFPYVPFKESEVLNTVRKDTPAPTPSPAPRATQSQQSNDRT